MGKEFTVETLDDMCSLMCDNQVPEKKEVKEFKSFFKEVKGNEGGKCHYPTRLDTYGCGCQHDCSYCVAPSTQVLMYDGNVRPISDVQVGDAIYGIVEGETYKKFTKATVLDKWTVRKPAYKITLANGNALVCSGDHRWLTNRGWKYTTGTMSGEGQRPYITTSNKLLGFHSLFNISYVTETDDYKRGYLRGVILGDANFKEYHYKDRGYRHLDDQYHFRLALINEDITDKVHKYLRDFEVITNYFDFPMKDRTTKEIYNVRAIRTHKKADYESIQAIIAKRDTIEFKRGFLAGIYDAEGNNGIVIRRIFNSDLDIIEDIKESLTALGFEYTMDKDTKPTNKVIKTVRLVGGVSESLRFNQITQCLVGSGVGRIEGLGLKTFKPDNLQVVSIEECGVMELVDITTTSENFIANGVVSHNCYAKSLLDFRKLWDFQNPAVADIEKIRKKVAKLPHMPAIRLGGMTDCFQPIELEHRVTLNTIKALNDKKQPYLIVTKSDIVAYPEYLEAMDKELAHIQVTITCFDDALYHKLGYEKAVPPSKRIEAVEKLYEAGFDVQVRLSPFIPEFVDYDVLANIKCDKLIVEFLRVNTWIRKWFDIDFTPYTVKHGGYNHLPLEKKKELISKIRGFKEISVCEDEDTAYAYWTEHFNPNPNDCCNLRHGQYDVETHKKSIAVAEIHSQLRRLV